MVLLWPEMVASTRVTARWRRQPGGCTDMLEALGLSRTAEQLYQAMLDQPAFGVAQLAAALAIGESQVHSALDDLADLMLVRTSREHPGRMRAVHPQVGLADMLLRQEAELAVRQAQVVASRAALTRLVAERADAHDSRSAHGERLLGMDAIQDRLEIMARSATWSAWA